MICTNVHQSSSFDPAPKYETKPTLTPRQLAAARLLVLGRTNRAIARELEVEVHTVSRWRRMPAFAAEVERLSTLALSIQLDKS